MTLTVEEVKEKLCRYDEITVLEVLDIASEELVERFEDKVEAAYDKLSEELDDGYIRDDGPCE